MEPRLTEYDLEHYVNKARERYGKPTVDADEYEESGDTFAAHANHFAAAACYALAAIRSLPDQAETARLFERARQALERTPHDVHALAP